MARRTSSSRSGTNSNTLSGLLAMSSAGDTIGMRLPAWFGHAARRSISDWNEIVGTDMGQLEQRRRPRCGAVPATVSERDRASAKYLLSALAELARESLSEPTVAGSKIPSAIS
jgi:hypothetical protein